MADSYDIYYDDYLNVLYNQEGEEDCDHELALSYLLKEKVLFASNLSVDKNNTEYTVCLYVDCNDVFMWGKSDAESITTEDLRGLYLLYRKDHRWGAATWCCLKRNMQPQDAIILDMKKHGSWTETMEKLKVNPYKPTTEETRHGN
jgi:hypothetical protein